MLIAGVVKVSPEPRNVPSVKESYQFTVPADAVALRFTVPEPQTLPELVLAISGIGKTVAVTGVLVNVVHPLSVAST